MLLLGFFSLCQIGFLPGYLCLRVFRVPLRGLLQRAIYSFALSLIANHSLVYALYSAGLYSAPVLYAIVTLEWLALFYMMRRENFWFTVSFPSEETLARYRALRRDHPVWGLLIAIPAFAALLAAAGLCYRYFGSVFLLNDDVLSWDRWATEWAANRLSGTGLYPQLLPANWSIAYVMMRNTDMKMFGKAIMPLFTLATLLLFLDLFHKTGRLTWLLGLSCYAFLLSFFFQPEFLASGYAEMANAFFAFLTLHAFLQRDPPAEVDAGCSRPFLVAAFASGTLLTKQGGVYVFALALGWLVIHFVRLRNRISWRAPACALVLILLLNWRWVTTEWRVLHGQTATNINYLTQGIHAGKTYPQRWKSAWEMIERARGPECTPLVWLVAGAALLALLDPHGRLIFLLIFAPFYVLWAFLFSYEARTLAMDLPFAADCVACGVTAAAAFCLRGYRFVLSRIPRAAAPARFGGSTSKAAKRAAKKAPAGKQAPIPSPVPGGRWLRWLLGGAAFAALIPTGVPIGLWAAILHWVRSSAWLLDMTDTWRWPLAAGCGFAILASGVIHRLSPFGKSHRSDRMPKQKVTSFGQSHSSGRMPKQMVTALGQSHGSGRMPKQKVTSLGQSHGSGRMPNQMVTRLRLRLPAPALLLACAGAIAVAQTTLWPSRLVLREQLEKRKNVGSPALNRKLYEYAQRKPLSGRILTDNYFLEYLPELNRYRRYLLFPQPATPEFLEGVLADPDAGYILAYEPAFPPPVLLWMSQRGFKSIFEEQGYRFFELPANRPRPGIGVFATGFNLPLLGTVTGWLQGAGFRDGDLVLVNGNQHPTVYENERALTFDLPASLLSRPFWLEVFRPGSGERSHPYRVMP